MVGFAPGASSFGGRIPPALALDVDSPFRRGGRGFGSGPPASICGATGLNYGVPVATCGAPALTCGAPAPNWGDSSPVVRERSPEYGVPWDSRAPSGAAAAPPDAAAVPVDAAATLPDFAPASAHAATAPAHAAAPARAAPIPHPHEEVDALEDLEEEIVVLAAHIHAATHRFLSLIADFDRRRGWELGGHRSCAHWLHVRTGFDLATAREKVRTARALEALPETSESMSRGRLSFSKVRALTRVASPENESDLLELAEGCTTAQIEKMIRAYRMGSREDEVAAERRRHRKRTLSVFPDEDGMYLVRGRLTAEVGALLMRAVEAASDALYREKRPEWEKEESERDGARLRADALGLLAERALAVGFGGDDDEAEAPISGSRAERYQVVLHVEPETLVQEAGEGGKAREKNVSAETSGSVGAPARALAAGGPASGLSAGPRSHLEDGTRVSAETSRRLSCDAGIVPMSHDSGGSILNVGRRTRTIPPALRRALDARDGGCRFPGCGVRFCDAHHITHWADGGETSLENCLLLCKAHHRLLHEDGWKLDWWGEGRPVFIDPRGGFHYDGRWQPPELGDDPAEALVEGNRRRGVDPDYWTAGARWERGGMIPEEVYYRGVEMLCAPCIHL